MSEIKVAMNGAGAAAIAIAKILISAGVKDIILCDRTGLIYKGRENGMNKMKLTLWEAAEVHFDEGVLLCALTDMGILRKMMHDSPERKFQRRPGDAPAEERFYYRS